MKTPAVWVSSRQELIIPGTKIRKCTAVFDYYFSNRVILINSKLPTADSKEEDIRIVVTLTFMILYLQRTVSRLPVKT